MPEVYAALIGAAATAFLMVLSNMSNRRERDIRELFNRLNQLGESRKQDRRAKTIMFGMFEIDKQTKC